MRVEWTEVHIPPTDILENYLEDGLPWPAFPATTYRGEVINAIRTLGETRLVVMLDSGEIVEVKANRLRRVVPPEPGSAR